RRLLCPSKLPLRPPERKRLVPRLAFAPKSKSARSISPPFPAELRSLQSQLASTTFSSSPLSFVCANASSENPQSPAPWFDRCTIATECFRPCQSSSSCKRSCLRGDHDFRWQLLPRAFGSRQLSEHRPLRSGWLEIRIPPARPGPSSFAGHSTPGAARHDLAKERRLQRNNAPRKQAAGCRGYKNMFRFHRRPCVLPS